MSKKSKYSELYLNIKELNAKGKYKEVVKYATKYLEMQGPTGIKCDKVKFMKAKALRELEKFDEAIEVLKKESDNTFFALELYFIYYYLNRYEEALELLPRIYEYDNKDIKNYSLSIMELVMKKHLGLDTTFKEGTYGDSIKKQIVDYDEELAKAHIKSHSFYKAENCGMKSVFNENVDIDYLIDSIKENLKTSKKVNKNENLEVHYFLVPNIGIYKNTKCNYLKVILIPGTNNIITVYPASYTDANNIPILNCDYDRLFSKKYKVKML